MDPDHWQPFAPRPVDLVEPVRVDPSGRRGPTWGQVRGSRYRQTSPGVYVAATADESVVEQRILEQSRRLRRQGAVTAWAALRWYGAQYFDGTDVEGRRLPVPLVVGESHLRADSRVAVSQEQVAPTEVRSVDGVVCTTVQRALFDEVRRCASTSIREAVVAVDMTAAAGLISVSLFGQYVAQRASWTGVPDVRRALVLSSDEARSPQESRMRLVWIIDAGLPPPRCNRPVYALDGALIGVPDLFDPAAGLVGEYDGAAHKRSARHRRDVAREERFRDHGLEYFELVGGDLRDRTLCVTRMRNARARARFLPPESRAWTVEPPPWRPAPESLDARLRRTGRTAELTHI